MDRICEPELMDGLPQARAYAEADFASSDQALVEGIVALLGQRSGRGGSAGRLRLVDLGCGPGNISLRLAEALPSARVLGIDGARPMLELAEQRRLAQADRWPGLEFRLLRLPSVACAEPPLAASFDGLVSNSLLHHLHDPAVLWSSVRQLAAPGALVVVRDLRRPASQEALDGLVERYAAGAPALLRRDYALSLRAAFRREEVSEQLRAAGLDGLTVREQNDRYLEVIGRLEH
jgi:2-polyprenyl-3-methyl-5-hydroxy-6-metoxy-1,4-benzoquinol methylase